MASPDFYETRVVVNARTRTWLLTGLAILLLAPVAGGCGNSKTMKGPEIGGAGKGCYQYTTNDKEFKHVSQQATVETKWYDEWTSRHGKTLPDPLPPPNIWQHACSRSAFTMAGRSSIWDISVL